MNNKASIIIYDIALPMEQTYLLAADYRHSTGQALPAIVESGKLSLELANSDGNLDSYFF